MNRRRSVLVSVFLGLLVVSMVGGLVLFFIFVNKLSDPGSGPRDARRPVVFGIRSDGGELTISSGKSCPSGTRLNVSFEGEKVATSWIEVVLKLPESSVNILPPSAGVEVVSSSGSFTWQSYRWISINGSDSEGKPYEHGSMTVPDIEAQSKGRARDEFYFGEKIGWARSGEIAARDGKDLYTVCSPH